MVKESTGAMKEKRVRRNEEWTKGEGEYDGG
jgi:hypothetical protein